MLTVEDEDDLIEDIKEGVEIAIYEGEFDTDDIEIDPIKLNKLAWWMDQQIDEVNLTYGWFKYGPAPVDVVQPSRDASTTSVGIRPKSPDEVEAAHESRVPTPDERYPTPREFAYVFLRDLQDEFETILTTPTKEYLLEFYEKNAPSQYRALYIESVKLQDCLDKIRESKDWHEDAEEYYNEVKDRLNRVYGELLQASTVKQTVDYFQRYSSVLAQILATAAAKDSLSDREQRFLKNKAVDYFYGGAWKYVALYISEATATGANVNKLLDGIDDDKRTLRNSFSEEIENMKQKAAIVGLAPEPVAESEAVERREGEGGESRSDLGRLDMWTRLSAEVISY